jgi:DNA-binding Xre family transcriptional regulator
MRKAKVTEFDLADHLGIPFSSMQRVLRGTDVMTTDFLVSFCASVGCSIHDVLPFSNAVLRYPYKYVTRGGGSADDIAPDPYRIALSDPDTMSEEWKEVKK